MNAELYDAVKDGNLERVKTLFDRPTGLKINKLHDDTETLLAAAVRQQHPDVVQFLIEKGADVNIKTYSGKAPLHLACFEGNLKITEILVTNGADKELKDDNGKTPLHWAVKTNRADITRVLASNGAQVNVQATGGDTLLHEAIANAEREVVECLLEYGAETRIANEEGEMPLHVAAKTGRDVIAEVLMTKDADINDFTKHGETVLHMCCRTGQIKMVYHLLDVIKITPDYVNKQTTGGKSQINGKAYNTLGWTALHMACAKGHLDIVQALIDHSANKEIQAKDKKTAGDVARNFNQDKIVSLLTGEDEGELKTSTSKDRRASVPNASRKGSISGQSTQNTRKSSVGSWKNF